MMTNASLPAPLPLSSSSDGHRPNWPLDLEAEERSGLLRRRGDGGEDDEGGATGAATTVSSRRLMSVAKKRRVVGIGKKQEDKDGGDDGVAEVLLMKIRRWQLADKLKGAPPDKLGSAGSR
jgi:hypothetical protein